MFLFSYVQHIFSLDSSHRLPHDFNVKFSIYIAWILTLYFDTNSYLRAQICLVIVTPTSRFPVNDCILVNFVSLGYKLMTNITVFSCRICNS